MGQRIYKLPLTKFRPPDGSKNLQTPFNQIQLVHKPRLVRKQFREGSSGSTQFLRTAFRLMIMHHHTRFGYRKAEWFCTGLPDKARTLQTDRQTHRHGGSIRPHSHSQRESGYRERQNRLRPCTLRTAC